MTSPQESRGASRVSWYADGFRDGVDSLAPVLDGTRRKSEDYELRAKAAEATLAKVRAWAESALATQAWESFDDGRQFSARAALYILDGKTK